MPIAVEPPTMLARLERWQWLLPVISFAGGWIGYVAIERGPALARIVAVTALLSWPLLLLEPLAGRWLQRISGGRLSPHMACFLTQSMQQELLFFSLPFVLGAAQLDPAQGVFVAVLLVAAMLSTLDPVYQKHIAGSPVAAVWFQVYCTWIAALVVLPIALHLPLEHSAPLASIVALIALAASLPRLLGGLTGLGHCLRAAVPVMVAIIAVTLFAAALPAAGLRLTEARLTTTIEGLQPGTSIQRIDVSTLRREGLIAYSAIHAPAGLKQGLSFDWYHDRICVDRIPAEIEGVGEKSRSWRTWTRKRNFEGDPSGQWRVDIRTTGGQLVGRLPFVVTP